MRYLLTGDYFDSVEAYRIGLVQEVVKGSPFDRALELAQTVADQAPLGVYATLKNARKVLAEAEKAAIPDLLPTAIQLMQTEDAAEGLQSFLERRKAQFKGK
jgi:enoyl-CoA hydratase/carnithine racemase